MFMEVKKMQGIIHDTQTGLISTYEYDKKEIAECQKNKEEFDAYLQNQEQIVLEKIKAKAATEAKLAALGLTTEDLKVLGL